MARKLNIVNEAGKVIGEDTRENIHKKGLLHREVHVWFYTSEGEIIFQHRGKTVDTFPDLLDATVGGHVELGMGYVDTALKEIREETGVEPRESDVRQICVVRSKAYDPVKKMTNNVLRAIYAYRFSGDLGRLKIEKGKSLGFEAWAIEKLLNVSDVDRAKFIPSMLEPEMFEIYRRIVSH